MSAHLQWGQLKALRCLVERESFSGQREDKTFYVYLRDMAVPLKLSGTPCVKRASPLAYLTEYTTIFLFVRASMQYSYFENGQSMKQECFHS